MASPVMVVIDFETALKVVKSRLDAAAHLAHEYAIARGDSRSIMLPMCGVRDGEQLYSMAESMYEILQDAVAILYELLTDELNDNADTMACMCHAREAYFATIRSEPINGAHCLCRFQSKAIQERCACRRKRSKTRYTKQEGGGEDENDKENQRPRFAHQALRAPPPTPTSSPTKKPPPKYSKKCEGKGKEKISAQRTLHTEAREDYDNDSESEMVQVSSKSEPSVHCYTMCLMFEATIRETKSVVDSIKCLIAHDSLQDIEPQSVSWSRSLKRRVMASAATFYSAFGGGGEYAILTHQRVVSELVELSYELENISATVGSWYHVQCNDRGAGRWM